MAIMPCKRLLNHDMKRVQGQVGTRLDPAPDWRADAHQIDAHHESPGRHRLWSSLGVVLAGYAPLMLSHAHSLASVENCRKTCKTHFVMVRKSASRSDLT